MSIDELIVNPNTRDLFASLGIPEERKRVIDAELFRVMNNLYALDKGEGISVPDVLREVNITTRHTGEIAYVLFTISEMWQEACQHHDKMQRLVKLFKSLMKK